MPKKRPAKSPAGSPSDEPPTEVVPIVPIVPIAPVQPVTYQTDPPAAILTLNRPERRNAIGQEIIAGLHDALDRALDDDSVRGVILTGAGSAFSAGVDLSEVRDQKERSYDEHLAAAEALARLFRRLRSFEKVTIAAVNGPALGSGCGLATLCDFTLAIGSARFGYPEVRYGFVPAVVAVYLRDLLGEKRVRDLLLTGRILSADEALEFGIVSEVLPSGDLIDRGKEIAREIAANAPAAIRMTKELLEMLPGLDTDRAIKAAVDANARQQESFECSEGVAAFFEKRAPDWTAAQPPPPAEEEPPSEA
jgi:methylglutaconyl-CoA hydratase